MGCTVSKSPLDCFRRARRDNNLRAPPVKPRPTGVVRDIAVVTNFLKAARMCIEVRHNCCMQFTSDEDGVHSQISNHSSFQPNGVQAVVFTTELEDCHELRLAHTDDHVPCAIVCCFAAAFDFKSFLEDPQQHALVPFKSVITHAHIGDAPAEFVRDYEELARNGLIAKCDEHRSHCGNRLLIVGHGYGGLLKVYVTLFEAGNVFIHAFRRCDRTFACHGSLPQRSHLTDGCDNIRSASHTK
jgi:hypothetical protein